MFGTVNAIIRRSCLKLKPKIQSEGILHFTSICKAQPRIVVVQIGSNLKSISWNLRCLLYTKSMGTEMSSSKVASDPVVQTDKATFALS
ncbi:hypothetical protein EB796_022154 [Bugula neritina]|uniref:Uncharacterized protein n=1 Tax=Bugula neritina TaxID=10212 RepID=A0A7J7J065_BUGNE|nr:hypothetical protein EB796_022154 [Bugula neritina]